MKRYKPMEHIVEIPYLPEHFMDELARRAEAGTLFPRAIPVQVDIQAQRPDYLRVWVVAEDEVRTLRFDCMEIWQVDDHHIRLRVAYRSWFRNRLREALDIGFMHFVGAILTGLFVLLAIVLPEALMIALGDLFWSTRGTSESHPGTARPALRELGQHLKHMAASTPR